MHNGRQQTLPYNLVARLFVTPFLFCVKVWPLWLSRSFAWFVTAVYYPFATRRRRNYQANLRHILGDNVSRRRLFSTTFRMFVNCAYYLIDLFRFDETDTESVQELLSGARGYDNIREALSRGKGAILLTAHMGNWELGGIVLSRLGHAVNIVYFPDGSGRIDESRTRQRLGKGVKEIRLDPDNISPIAMMRALEKNEIVAIQGDKLYNDKGVKVDFFGAPAYFPKGPVLLAMLSGAPIVPSFIVMETGGGYSIIVEPPITMSNTGRREKDIEQNMKKVVAVLERYIGRHHDQWYCMTRFWEQ